MARGKHRGVLTPKQLQHVGTHAMQNARSLLVEAGLLRGAGHHARAVALAALALEEAGKAYQCAFWGGHHAEMQDADWQEFWDHFIDHSVKYGRAIAMDWMVFDEQEAASGWSDEKLQEAKRLAGEGQKIKQWAFYVGFENGSVSCPDKLDRRVCEDYLLAVEDLFSRIPD